MPANTPRPRRAFRRAGPGPAVSRVEWWPGSIRVRSGSAQGRSGQTRPARHGHAGEMTTTTSRTRSAGSVTRPARRARPPHGRPGPPDDRQPPPTGSTVAAAADRRAALLAIASLVAVTVLSIPATALLDTADATATRVVVGVGFVVVAALEVVVGWGLYGVLHERAHSCAYAALVSRAGYAVLLAAAAGRLLWPGGDGVAGFRADWSLALLVLGVHLLVTTVALWHSHEVPGAVVAGTAVAGTAALLGEVVGPVAAARHRSRCRTAAARRARRPGAAGLAVRRQRPGERAGQWGRRRVSDGSASATPAPVTEQVSGATPGEEGQRARRRLSSRCVTPDQRGAPQDRSARRALGLFCTAARRDPARWAHHQAQLVDEVGVEERPDRLGAPTQSHVEAAGRLDRDGERLLGRRVHEVERRASSHLQARAGMVGQHQNRCVEGGFVAPESLPVARAAGLDPRGTCAGP